ncbi:family 2 encapsulin nanocompartment cargo protein polyprenyl transferase [Actinokineospora bangkokensis]|uniref:Dimethylallyltranstransferase n=1 Tax=Actinokineospora bangkokensis TaxID=1193682 RepID=A0A1Q9LH06_9PSEU|nr:family 2 encapsulin nanocompartment cargo protein polyprenyl transferase [Actinokineospora bangkokensis]OLR91295.1 dimethylallyltranstransferase [Actinokineospora bangkokensis]
MSAVDVRPGRSARDVLARSRALLDPALRAAVDSLPGSMRSIAAYHLGWHDEHGRPTTADCGKAVRPALAFLAAEAVGGTPDAALPAAVAVELVHNFTLLHDDVMDGDRFRRHRPTAWSLFGTGPAILAGDALLTLAYDVVAAAAPDKSRASARLLSASVLAVQDGQAADLAFEQRTDVGVAECLRMAGGKTGALLGCSTALGALYGGGSPSQQDDLRAFGEKMGVSFQLADDLLGIWGDPETTGKPVHSDLANRKKSLPVVAALSSGTQAGEQLRALYGSPEPLSDAELAHAASLVELAGGRAWARRQADGLLDEAVAHLDAVRPAGRAGDELRALARLAAQRDR